MSHPVTAQDELLKRIRSLDQEESYLRRRAGNLHAEAARTEAEAEATAVLRRQFEFAFKQLGGELPKEAVSVQAKKPGRLVASLG